MTALALRIVLVAGAVCAGVALAQNASAPADKPNEKRQLLSTHETVARLKGIAYQQCRGLTAACPDNCGQSGDYATFEIATYVSYKKLGQYGDPKAATYTFQVEDNHKNLKVPAEMAKAVRDLTSGDYVLLNWRHDYVTRTEGGGSSSFPERPITKLAAITADEAKRLIQGGPTTASAPASQASGKTDPADLPLKARLVLNKDTYQLDPAQSGEAFAEKLKKLAKEMKQPPAPPEVDMTFELTNTSDKPVTITLDSDAGSLDLTLEGPGAVTVPYVFIRTMEFRGGRETTIQPGKSLTIPIKKLLHGSRGDGNASYWTAAGDYTLTAQLTAPVPSLKLERATITAAPVKVTVTAPAGATKPAP